jgi:hypothetical protein
MLLRKEARERGKKAAGGREVEGEKARDSYFYMLETEVLQWTLAYSQILSTLQKEFIHQLLIHKTESECHSLGEDAWET